MQESFLWLLKKQINYPIIPHFQEDIEKKLMQRNLNVY